MQEFHSLAGLASAFQRPRGYPITLGPPAPVKCPRCESTNTKFCYYNNYNLLQPRHFCKSCRRYWTRGGLLRNVPVGGGTRKSKSKSKSKTKSKKSFHVVEDNNNPNSNSNPSPEVPSTSETDIRGRVAIADPTMGFGFLDMVPQMGGNEFPTLHGNLCTNGDGFSGNNGNGSLFDVTGSVTYWNNHCSWADADPSALYLS